MTVTVEGRDVDFRVLHVLEFTSERKKSSIILRREDNSLVVRVLVGVLGVGEPMHRSLVYTSLPSALRSHLPSTHTPSQPQLFCKGADNIIKSRLSSTLNSRESLQRIDEHVMGYVNDGLRTLLLAKVPAYTRACMGGLTASCCVSGSKHSSNPYSIPPRHHHNDHARAGRALRGGLPGLGQEVPRGRDQHQEPRREAVRLFRFLVSGWSCLSACGWCGR